MDGYLLTSWRGIITHAGVAGPGQTQTISGEDDMSNTAKWVAGISGSAVAGISISYLGMGMLLRIYPVDSVELEDADDGSTDETGYFIRRVPPW